MKWQMMKCLESIAFNLKLLINCFNAHSDYTHVKKHVKGKMLCGQRIM